MVNNIKSTRRLEIMARLPKADDVWTEIFESLILDNEPPIEYIKNVTITTKTGIRLRVSAADFAQILERERYMHPDESDILSCRLAINFEKVRKDVNSWAEKFIAKLEGIKLSKPSAQSKPRVKKTTANTTDTPAKKTRTTKKTASTTKKTTATDKTTATAKKKNSK